MFKCRIVGKGFQEEYDDKLRRDSPTCSPFAQHLVCTVCANEGLDLYGADIKNAYVQGRTIDRDLYFKYPKFLGKCKLKGIAPGSLLKLCKVIYGINDAARAFWLWLSDTFVELGWQKHPFEPATFINKKTADDGTSY